LTDAEDSSGETARAERMLERAGFPNLATEAVLVQTRSRSVAPDAAAGDVEAMLRARHDVKNIKAPVRSRDGRSLLFQFDLTGDGDPADGRVQPVLDAVGDLQRSHPRFTIAEFGSASADHALNETIGKDFSHAERLSVPLTFLILLFAFGAFVAAG